nr:hypothetical protein [Tanacetum cinerariifolium]
MNHQYPTVAKIPVLDTGKFEQMQFQIQQYLQHEHYALWEVIEFGDSYKVPTNTDPNNTSTRKDDEQSGRTVTITTEDMKRKKNDVKARTTLLLSLPDEHYKYKTAKELWAAILKTFGGNEATKKRKKNLLKQQYGNFKAEGSKTLEQMFNRLQVMRNRNDLDTMSLVDLYNYLKVYEAKVQKKSNPSSQNMAFVSSSKHSSRDEDGNTTCVSTSSTTFPTASASVATISQDTATEEKTPKALIAIDGVGWDWSYMENEGEDHALVADAEAPIEFALMANTESKVFDNSLCSNDCKKNNDSLNSKIKDLTGELSEANNYIYHYKLAVAQLKGYNVVPPPAAADLYLSPRKDLSWTGLPEFFDDTVTDYSRPSPTIASTSAEGQNKDSSTSEDVASPNTPKPFVKFVKPKDSQSEKSSSEEDKNRNPSPSENVASPITPKQFVKFVKASDSQCKSKTDEKETPKKPPVKDVEQYRKPNKKPNVRGNQRNWNNLKSHQLEKGGKEGQLGLKIILIRAPHTNQLFTDPTDLK